MGDVRKLDTGSLEIGMYVVELDRPWLDSPFMFQGFRIETDEDLQKLRDCCRYVMIDNAMHDDSDRTIRLDVNSPPQQSVQRQPRQPAGHSLKQSAESDDIAAAAYRHERRMQMRRARQVRDDARNYVRNIFRDLRMGNIINTRDARLLVSEMVDVVTDDANSLLWMTQLRKQHEYTMQHCINVCVLSLAFACHLGYPKEELRHIGLGALLHDVGKIRTPPEILDKPGKLTPAEFDIMKRHPVDGYEIVRQSGDVPDEALEIIRYHHERISGHGYPDGLKADEINTRVLVVAIADVYDALTSDRVYHHGIPAHEGLSAMYQLAPNDFGRGLMTEFIRCIGIYPVGSLVELSNGALGIVERSNPAARLQPVVMLVRDAKGEMYWPRRHISLANPGEDGRQLSVRRVVDPKNYGMDLQAILVQELDVGEKQAVHA